MDIDALIKKSIALVEDLVTNTLYPTDTPDFEVQLLRSWTYDSVRTVYLMTDLPDEMRYEVHWNVAQTDASIFAFKQLEL